MKNKLNKYFLFIIVFGLVITGCTNGKVEKNTPNLPVVLSENPSKKEILTLIKKIKIPEAFKKLGAVAIIKRFDYKINSDKKKEKHIFKVYKIQNYEGVRSYSDWTINYNAKSEKLILGDMYTITPTGKIIEIPLKQSIEQDDSLSIMYPEYNHHKNRIINFSKVEAGSVVVINYTIIDNSNRELEGFYEFGDYIPVLKEEVSITYPKNKVGTIKPVGKKLKKSKIRKGKFNKITIVSPTQGDIDYENNFPYGFATPLPKVVFTFYKNWKEIGKKLDKIVAKSSKKTKILGKQFIKEYRIEKGINDNRILSKEEAIIALYEGIVRNFKKNGTYLEELNYEVKDLDKVIYKKYGNVIELNTLFLTLLKENNIKNAEPIMILDDLEKESKLFLKTPKNRSIIDLNILIDGKIYSIENSINYIDVTRGRYYYISKKNNYKPKQYTLGEKSEAVYEKKFLVRKDNTVSENKITYRYGWDSYLRELTEYPENQRIIAFIQRFKGIKGVMMTPPKFSDFRDLATPMSVTYQLFYNNFYVTQGNYIYFDLPKISSKLNVTSDERKYDYFIPRTRREEYSFIYDLSELKVIDGKKIDIINNLNNTLKFKYGKSIAKYISKVEIKEKKIILTRKLIIPAGTIKKEDYLKFKRFIQSIENPINNKIFLKVK